MNPDDAAKLYLKRITSKIPVYEIMGENELNYIRMINAGQKISYNNVSFGYLSHRIVFYLTNLQIKTRATYFVRAGAATDEDSYKADAPLSEEGIEYAKLMSEKLISHREEKRQNLIEKEGRDVPVSPLTVWTSTRLRTIQTAAYLKDEGYKVRQRSQMSQINPGVCESLSEKTIRQRYADEVEKHEVDPYHHRYPRAEVRPTHPDSIPLFSLELTWGQSYHDLAVRLEPIILELEREKTDLLIIAHESVLRVLYAYLMHCSTMEIPILHFPRDKIIEIIPAAYQNESQRIHIPGVDPKIIPSSPQDIRIPVAPGVGSGQMSPITGLSSPAEWADKPDKKEGNGKVSYRAHDDD
ncbi:histidine phosphatase family protein [Candidatus Bathyarchaeota archaeon]|nr:histidine phosphatase family protein [Candidatus Bathyarchaeota archaeon]